MKPLLLSVKKKKELEEFFHLFQGFNEDIKKISKWRDLVNHPYDFSLPSFSQELDELEQAYEQEFFQGQRDPLVFFYKKMILDSFAKLSELLEKAHLEPINCSNVTSVESLLSAVLSSLSQLGVEK